MLALQVVAAATLSPSTTQAAAGGAGVTFKVTLAGMAAAAQYTYTLDKGDGSTVGNCVALGTTSGGSLAETSLSGVTASYTATGTYSVVLRVYAATDCAANAAPPASNANIAAGSAVAITVSLSL